MQQKFLIRACKKKSLEALRNRGLWFPLALLIFLTELAFLGILLSFFLLGRFWGIEVTALGVYALLASTLVSLLLFSPLWRGIQMLFLHELLFKRKDASLIFYCFSHRRRYGYAVRRSAFELLSLLFSAVLIAFVIVFGLDGTCYLLRFEGETSALFALAITVLATLFVLFLYSTFCANRFLLDAAFLSAPLLSYRQLKTISKRRISYERETLRRFRCFFFPLWFISFLCLGLPLPILLPYYLGAKAHLAAAFIQD